MSAVGIDVVSIHKLFAYKLMSTVRIDVLSGHMKYCRSHMVSQDSRWTDTPCPVLLPRIGSAEMRGWGDVVMTNGTKKNLVGASTDFCAGCVQLRIRSTEPPGAHRYEN